MLLSGLVFFFRSVIKSSFFPPIFMIFLKSGTIKIEHAILGSLNDESLSVYEGVHI